MKEPSWGEILLDYNCTLYPLSLDLMSKWCIWRHVSWVRVSSDVLLRVLWLTHTQMCNGDIRSFQDTGKTRSDRGWNSLSSWEGHDRQQVGYWFVSSLQNNSYHLEPWPAIIFWQLAPLGTGLLMESTSLRRSQVAVCTLTWSRRLCLNAKRGE